MDAIVGLQLPPNLGGGTKMLGSLAFVGFVFSCGSQAQPSSHRKLPNNPLLTVDLVNIFFFFFCSD